MESGRQSDREETATMVDETCVDVNVLRKRPMSMVLEPCAHTHSVHEVCGVTMPLDYEIKWACNRRCCVHTPSRTWELPLPGRETTQKNDQVRCSTKKMTASCNGFPQLAAALLVH